MVWDNKGGKPIFGPQGDLKQEFIRPTEFQDEDITYGALGAQQLYLLSQNSKSPKGKIDLSNTLYGIPQDSFIGAGNTLYDRTYSSVRGEELVILLEKMADFLLNHVHAHSNKSPDENTQGSKTSKKDITESLANVNNTILNQNIRIN